MKKKRKITSEWPFGLLNRKKDRDTSMVPLSFALSPQAVTEGLTNYS